MESRVVENTLVKMKELGYRRGKYRTLSTLLSPNSSQAP